MIENPIERLDLRTIFVSECGNQRCLSVESALVGAKRSVGVGLDEYAATGLGVVAPLKYFAWGAINVGVIFAPTFYLGAWVPAGNTYVEFQPSDVLELPRVVTEPAAKPAIGEQLPPPKLLAPTAVKLVP